MKKTAVLIYNSFCNFEFSVALEILALAEKEVTIAKFCSSSGAS